MCDESPHSTDVYKQGCAAQQPEDTHAFGSGSELRLPCGADKLPKAEACPIPQS